MALIDAVKEDIPLLDSFQQGIEKQFENLLFAFYGRDYKSVLAKGKLLGDEKVGEVLYTIREIESKLGIIIIKTESK